MLLSYVKRFASLFSQHMCLEALYISKVQESRRHHRTERTQQLVHPLAERTASNSSAFLPSASYTSVQLATAPTVIPFNLMIVHILCITSLAQRIHVIRNLDRRYLGSPSSAMFSCDSDHPHNQMYTFPHCSEETCLLTLNRSKNLSSSVPTASTHPFSSP